MNLPKQRDLLSIFGNPSQPGWTRLNISYVAPPWKMYSGGLEVHTIPINKFIAEDFKAILQEIWIAAGKDQAIIHKWGMDVFDGSHVVRNISGSKNRLSNHAFAMAVDFDARHNPLGKKGRFTNNHPVVKIFKAHGWRHGGDYRKRKDPMHFEAVSG